MFGKRIFMFLAVAIVMAMSAVMAGAQTSQRAGWSRALRNTDIETLRERARSDEKQTDQNSEAKLSNQPVNISRKKALTGTWRVSIPQSATGLPPFKALHTFGEDGTFVETSDLLATLAEGPAHGVWEFKSGKFNLTFELFVFDENQQPVGMVRVRCSIELINDDEFLGDSSVDFIEPDGNVIADIDSSPFTGKRVRITPR